ncbi:transcriptional regulator [Streptomyces sp. SID11385]|uniref:transcriptional regulator n=1 Tax=Streptomyces sp. SID11385 TaxID=2706031 RepID=UPI0013C9FAB2|nr:transcriptional regulator [Streptomyces sp. SID11385]NEA39879.1 transcriptional regulator [Streptomyces sp. SID11385]
MLATPSGTPACPDTDRQQRLAVLLADMIPGAATIRVSLNDPARTWPHPHTIVKDETDTTLNVRRTTARIAARWIMRAWPEADWTVAHTLDLATATLSAVAGRGC